MPIAFEIKGVSGLDVISADSLHDEKFREWFDAVPISQRIASRAKYRMVYRDTRPQAMLGELTLDNVADFEIRSTRVTVWVDSQHSYVPAIRYTGHEIPVPLSAKAYGEYGKHLRLRERIISSEAISGECGLDGICGSELWRSVIAMLGAAIAIRNLKKHAASPLWPFTNLSATTPSTNRPLTGRRR